MLHGHVPQTCLYRFISSACIECGVPPHGVDASDASVFRNSPKFASVRYLSNSRSGTVSNRFLFLQDSLALTDTHTVRLRLFGTLPGPTLAPQSTDPTARLSPPHPTVMHVRARTRNACG